MSYICPKCDRELTRETQWHHCARVDLNDLFKGKSDELVLTFDKLLAEVAEWPDVLVGVTPNCITFVHRQTFLRYPPHAKSIELKVLFQNQNRRTARCEKHSLKIETF